MFNKMRNLIQYHVFARSFFLWWMLVFNLPWYEIALAAPWTPENALYNLNLEKFPDPTLYYGKWDNHTYTTSFDDWRDHVIYHILLDRFADGDPLNNDIGYDGYEPSSIWSRHGGDFTGLISKLDYLKALGVDILYISNPLQNYKAGYHGFHTKDFTLIDERLGTLQQFRCLVDAVHEMGMRIILDLPLNHMSNLLYTNGFNDYYKTGSAPYSLHEKLYTLHYYDEAITYEDFVINNTYVEDYVFPVPFAANYYGMNDTKEGGFPYCDFNHNGESLNTNNIFNLAYASYFGGLSDLNTANLVTRKKLIQMTKALISSTDIDGFRLDAAAHLHTTFWYEFAKEIRNHSSSLGKHNFYLAGEIYLEPIWETLIGKGTYSDGTEVWPSKVFNGFQNFIYYNDVVVDHSFVKLVRRLKSKFEQLIKSNNKWESYIYTAMQDKNRFKNPKKFFKIITLMQLAFPGIPYIYYGQEQFYPTESFAEDPTLSLESELSREDMFSSVSFSEDRQLNYSAKDNFDMRSENFRFYQIWIKAYKSHKVFRWGDEVDLLYADGNVNSEVVFIRKTISSEKHLEESHAMFAASFNEFMVESIIGVETGLKDVISLPTIIVNLFNESETFTVDVNGIIADVITLRPLEAKAFLIYPHNKPLQFPYVQTIFPSHDAVVDPIYIKNHLRFLVTFTEAVDFNNIVSKISFNGVKLTNDFGYSSEVEWNATSNTLSISLLNKDNSVFKDSLVEGIHYLRIEEIVSSENVSMNVPFISRVRIGNCQNNVLMLKYGNILWSAPSKDAVRIRSITNETDHAFTIITIKHFALGCNRYRVSVPGGIKWTDWYSCPKASYLNRLNQSFFYTNTSLEQLSIEEHQDIVVGGMLIVQYTADISASYFVYYKLESSPHNLSRRFPDIYLYSHRTNQRFYFPLVSDYTHHIKLNRSFYKMHGSDFTLIYFRKGFDEIVTIGEARSRKQNDYYECFAKGRVQLNSPFGVRFSQEEIWFHEKNMTFTEFGSFIEENMISTTAMTNFSISGSLWMGNRFPMFYNKLTGLYEFIFVLNEDECLLYGGYGSFFVIFENTGTNYKVERNKEFGISTEVAFPPSEGKLYEESRDFIDYALNCSEPALEHDYLFSQAITKSKSWLFQVNASNYRYKLTKLNKTFFPIPRLYLCLDWGHHLGYDFLKYQAHQMRKSPDQDEDTWSLIIFLTPQYKRIVFDVSGICRSSLGLIRENVLDTYDSFIIGDSLVSGNTTFCVSGSMYECPETRVNQSGYYQILFNQKFQNFSIYKIQQKSEVDILNEKWTVRSSLGEWAPTLPLGVAPKDVSPKYSSVLLCEMENEYKEEDVVLPLETIFACPASEVQLKVFHEINSSIIELGDPIVLEGFYNLKSKLSLGGSNIVYFECLKRPGIYRFSLCLNSMFPLYRFEFMSNFEKIVFVSTPHFTFRRLMTPIASGELQNKMLQFESVNVLTDLESDILFYVQIYSEDPVGLQYLFDFSDDFSVKVGQSWKKKEEFNFDNTDYSNCTATACNKTVMPAVYKRKGILNGPNFNLSFIPTASYTVVFDPSSFNTFVISPQKMYIRGDFNEWKCTEMNRVIKNSGQTGDDHSVFSECFHQWKIDLVLSMNSKGGVMFDSSCDWNDNNYFGRSSETLDGNESYSFSEDKVSIIGNAQYMSFTKLNFKDNDNNTFLDSIKYDKGLRITIYFNDMTLKYSFVMETQLREMEYTSAFGYFGIIFAVFLYIIMLTYFLRTTLLKNGTRTKFEFVTENQKSLHKNDACLSIANEEDLKMCNSVAKNTDNNSDSKNNDVASENRDCTAKVLHVAMEYSIPDLNVRAIYGGLGKVVDLFVRKTEPSLFCVPFFRNIENMEEIIKNPKTKLVLKFQIQTLKKYGVRIFEYKSPPNSSSNGAVYYLIDCIIFSDRKVNQIYRHGSELDELEFFSIFSQSVAKVVENLNVKHIHYHDYHGSLASLLLLLAREKDKEKRKLISSSMTIHNGHYQGVWNAYSMWRRRYLCKIFNVPMSIFNEFINDGGNWNLLNAYVSYCKKYQNSEGLCTVSEKYAAYMKIKFPMFWSIDQVVSILNAVDENDKPNLSCDRNKGINIEEIIKMKSDAKLAIQKLFNLKVGAEYDLLVFLGRQSYQKGMDIAADRVERILKKFSKCQFVFVGPVEDEYGKHAVNLIAEKVCKQYPNRAYAADRMVLGKEKDLLIKATDFVLCPSRFEPCGLVDIEFGWYGALVIGFKTGGLGKMPGFYSELNTDNYLHSKRMFYEVLKAALKASTEIRNDMMIKALLKVFSVSEWKCAYQNLWKNSMDALEAGDNKGGTMKSTKFYTNNNNNKASNSFKFEEVYDHYEEEIFIEKHWRNKNNVSSGLVKSRSKSFFSNDWKINSDGAVLNDIDDDDDDSFDDSNEKSDEMFNFSKLRNHEEEKLNGEKKGMGKGVNTERTNTTNLNRLEVIMKSTSSNSENKHKLLERESIEMATVGLNKVKKSSSRFSLEKNVGTTTNSNFEMKVIHEGDNVIIKPGHYEETKSEKGKSPKSIDTREDVPYLIYFLFLLMPFFLVFPSLLSLGFVYTDLTFKDFLFFGIVYYVLFSIFSVVWSFATFLMIPKNALYAVFICGILAPCMTATLVIYGNIVSEFYCKLCVLGVSALLSGSKPLFISLNMLTVETTSIPIHKYIAISESSQYLSFSVFGLILAFNVSSDDWSYLLVVGFLFVSITFMLLCILIVCKIVIFPERYSFKALDISTHFSKFLTRKVALSMLCIKVLEEFANSISIGIGLLLLEMNVILLTETFEPSFLAAMLCSLVALFLFTFGMNTRRGQKYLFSFLLAFSIFPSIGLLRSIIFTKTTGQLFIIGYAISEAFHTLRNLSTGLIVFQTLTRELNFFYIQLLNLISSAIMLTVFLILRNDVIIDSTYIGTQLEIGYIEKKKFMEITADKIILLLIAIEVLRSVLYLNVTRKFPKENIWSA